jgi:RNA polymerase sigma-70 factor (ECF subfamily)
MAPSDKTTTIPGTSAKLVSLVNQASKGNRAAFAKIADRFHQDIFRMVFYRVRSKVDAEDITQDVFLKAYQKISGIRDAAKFRGWLFTIALNRIRDVQRKKRFRGLFKAEEEEIESHPDTLNNRHQPEALEQVMRNEFWQHIGNILKKLPRMEREVFLLRFFDQLSIGEISSVLKKSESTVKTHLYRSLAKFRKEPVMRQLLNEVMQ